MKLDLIILVKLLALTFINSDEMKLTLEESIISPNYKTVRFVKVTLNLDLPKVSRESSVSMNNLPIKHNLNYSTLYCQINESYIGKNITLEIKITYIYDEKLLESARISNIEAVNDTKFVTLKWSKIIHTYCNKIDIPKYKEYIKDRRKIEPKQYLLKYQTCLKNSNFRNYITSNPDFNFQTKKNNTKRYFIDNIHAPSQSGFLQFWNLEDQTLYSLVIADKLIVSIKPLTIKQNSTAICSSNLPNPILTYKWNCMINSISTEIREDYKYNATKYKKDELFILNNIVKQNNELNFTSNIPMYIYKCYCESLFYVNSIKYSNKKEVNFINKPIITHKEEKILHKNRVRGIIIILKNVKSLLVEKWHVKFGKSSTKQPIPNKNINNNHLFIEVNDSFIGKKLNLIIYSCFKAFDECIQWNTIQLTYCDKKFIPSYENLTEHTSVVRQNKLFIIFETCRRNTTINSFITVNPSAEFRKETSDSNYYFINTIYTPNRFTFLQLWVQKDSELYTLMIADDLKISIQPSAIKANSDIQCTTNFPNIVVQFTWKCLIKKEWIKLKNDSTNYDTKHSKDELTVLQHISLKNVNVIQFSSKLPINIYICSCRAELIHDASIYDEKKVVFDTYDPIITYTEEYIIFDNKDPIRCILVHLKQVKISLISYWKVRFTSYDNWLIYSNKYANDTHFFIPIDEELIKQTIILRMKSCPYSSSKCITWQSKVLKYCENEIFEYNLNVIKDLSIWNPLDTIATFQSCSKKPPVTTFLQFNPQVKYKVISSAECCNKNYFLYEFYIDIGTYGFYQFLLLKNVKVEKTIQYFSIVIYEEIKLSLKPNDYNLNMTTRCISSLPDNILAFKWSCVFDKKRIFINSTNYEYEYQEIFYNLYLKESHTLYFGNELPLKYYTCFCEVSFFLKPKWIKQEQQFVFDFKALYLNEVLAKLTIKIFPYSIIIMFMWYLLSWIVFNMITYVINFNIYKTLLKNTFACYYDQRKKRKSTKHIYTEYIIPKNHPAVAPMIAANNKFENRKKKEIPSPMIFFVKRDQNNLLSNLNKLPLDPAIRKSIKQRIKKRKTVISKIKVKPVDSSTDDMKKRKKSRKSKTKSRRFINISLNQLDKDSIKSSQTNVKMGERKIASKSSITMKFMSLMPDKQSDKTSHKNNHKKSFGTDEKKSLESSSKKSLQNSRKKSQDSTGKMSLLNSTKSLENMGKKSLENMGKKSLENMGKKSLETIGKMSLMNSTKKSLEKMGKKSQESSGKNFRANSDKKFNIVVEPHSRKKRKHKKYRIKNDDGLNKTSSLKSSMKGRSKSVDQSRISFRTRNLQHRLQQFDSTDSSRMAEFSGNQSDTEILTSKNVDASWITLMFKSAGISESHQSF